MVYGFCTFVSVYKHQNPEKILIKIKKMTKKDFFIQVEELLELEGELETNDSTLIEDVLEIDSLAHITLISFIKDELSFDLKVEDFSKFNTLLDVVNAIGSSKFD